MMAPPCYLQQLRDFQPQCIQEERDQALILRLAERTPDTILTRKNPVFHLTASGFLMNRDLSRVLLVHHNIYRVWAWTGGHADGETDLLSVAIREALEETGITNAFPLTEGMDSLDILTVDGHMRQGTYISAHLHLNAAYVLIAEETDTLAIRPQENSGVRWFDAGDIPVREDEPDIRAVYDKLLARAWAHREKGGDMP